MLKIREKIGDKKTPGTDSAVIEMDRSNSSKVFLAVFFLAIALSLGVSYWRIVVKRDYDISVSADCDPYTERCFVHVCDPDPNVDGADCTGNLDEDIWYAKNMTRKAYNIPECDPSDEDCTALKCEDGEPGCSYELCDQTNVPEGDTCNDPEQYAKDNPEEEYDEDDADDSECAEDDQQCLDASGADGEGDDSEDVDDDSCGATGANDTCSASGEEE